MHIDDGDGDGDDLTEFISHFCPQIGILFFRYKYFTYIVLPFAVLPWYLLKLSWISIKSVIHFTIFDIKVVKVKRKMLI